MVEWLISLPVVLIIVEDESAYRAGAVISWLAGELTIPEILRDSVRPGIEQSLVRIETKATLLSVAGTVETPVVEHTSRQSLNVNVPAIERAIEARIETDDLKRHGALRLFVQQQLGARRPLTPDGKID